MLFDKKLGVVKTAKAPTTRHKLSVGIEAAVRAVLTVPPSAVELVSLSSTLATNAIVEGQGSPVCLLLLGYEPRLVEEASFGKLVSDGRIAFIAGGHTVTGDEQQPLDIQRAREVILQNAPHVAAFAVSGYFSVRNPHHELKVKELARTLTGLPVTCGHELTSQLDAPRRAVTVALNARLIPLMHHLILETKGFLTSLGIGAPLMVVKGDGSLIDAEMALERPVETVLSGPAASVIGAMHLSRKKTGIVADIGGTTTDVAVVRKGFPALSSQGARVGGWQTMVEALDVHTTGLGGDSEVKVEKDGALVVGPRRVVPLCMLASEHPAVLDVLREEARKEPDPEYGRFVIRQRQLSTGRELTERARSVWDKLEAGPLSLEQLTAGAASPAAVAYAASDLIDEGIIASCAFTPTDAAHVLGFYDVWCAEASRLGAEIWARRLGMTADEFCRAVGRRVVVQAGQVILETALAEEGAALAPEGDHAGKLFIDRALGAVPPGNVKVAVSLKLPVIGVGAPAETYLKPLAGTLHTALLVPPHAEVGNAVGAVVGGVAQTVHISIRRPAGVDGPFRVYDPSGIREFMEIDDALVYAKAAARQLATHRARMAGADHARVHVQHDEAMMGEAGDTVFLGAEVTATAVGRPRLGKHRQPPFPK